MATMCWLEWQNWRQETEKSKRVNRTERTGNGQGESETTKRQNGNAENNQHEPDNHPKEGISNTEFKNDILMVAGVCCVVSSYATVCHVMWFYVMLCYSMPWCMCCVMSCHCLVWVWLLLSCYARLCHVMSYSYVILQGTIWKRGVASGDQYSLSIWFALILQATWATPSTPSSEASHPSYDDDNHDDDNDNTLLNEWHQANAIAYASTTDVCAVSARPSIWNHKDMFAPAPPTFKVEKKSRKYIYEIMMLFRTPVHFYCSRCQYGSLGERGFRVVARAFRVGVVIFASTGIVCTST